MRISWITKNWATLSELFSSYKHTIFFKFSSLIPNFVYFQTYHVPFPKRSSGGCYTEKPNFPTKMEIFQKNTNFPSAIAPLNYIATHITDHTKLKPHPLAFQRIPTRPTRPTPYKPTPSEVRVKKISPFTPKLCGSRVSRPARSFASNFVKIGPAVPEIWRGRFFAVFPIFRENFPYHPRRRPPPFDGNFKYLSNALLAASLLAIDR